MNEKRIECKKLVASVLGNIMRKYPYSQECVDCPSGNQLFLDCSNFVGMHSELCELQKFLLKMINYEENCENV